MRALGAAVTFTLSPSSDLSHPASTDHEKEYTKWGSSSYDCIQHWFSFSWEMTLNETAVNGSSIPISHMKCERRNDWFPDSILKTEYFQFLLTSLESSQQWWQLKKKSKIMFQVKENLFHCRQGGNDRSLSAIISLGALCLKELQKRRGLRGKNGPWEQLSKSTQKDSHVHMILEIDNYETKLFLRPLSEIVSFCLLRRSHVFPISNLRNF